jgi:TetR/AcrR family transcriptional regulator, mexCD-oprJ operon repressor
VECEIEPATTGQGTARPRRADAVRNIAAILEAATECLSRDPDASIAEIAAAAGVGRITLYGHFKTRAELVDAVLIRTVEQANRLLDATDTTGEPRAALARLTAASWQIVDRFRNLTVSALRELPPERILAAHDLIMRRIESIIERGQRSGDFRTDLPVSWLVAVAVNLMHLAATEAAAGRVSSDEVPGLLSATLLPVLSPQGSAAVPAADHPPTPG